MKGRRVVAKLEEHLIERAFELGVGNVAEGIRIALTHLPPLPPKA
jgi:hypothetical protein